MGLRGPKPIADRTLLLTTAYPIYDDLWTLAKGGRRTVRQRTSGGSVEYTGFKIPAEPDTLIALLEATTVQKIRKACLASAWMAKQPDSHLAWCLPKFANQFQKAKSDGRFPKSDRPSSISKKLWFLAVALAGAMYGLSARRAVNKIGPGTPEELFDRLPTPEYVVNRVQPKARNI
jgi:hypothetical protein